MRIEGWESKLYDYIEASRNTAFAWGETDCALWVGGFVDSITGSAFVGQWSGLYDSAESAEALLQELGIGTLEDLANTMAQPVKIKLAGRGDVVMYQGALGICDGRRSYFLTENNGLVALLTVQCSKAWRI